MIHLHTWINARIIIYAHIIRTYINLNIYIYIYTDIHIHIYMSEVTQQPLPKNGRPSTAKNSLHVLGKAPSTRGTWQQDQATRILDVTFPGFPKVKGQLGVPLTYVHPLKKGLIVPDFPWRGTLGSGYIQLSPDKEVFFSLPQPTFDGRQKSGEKTHRLDVKKWPVNKGINYQSQLPVCAWFLNHQQPILMKCQCRTKL